MNPVDFVQSLVQRTSQFTFHNWLIVFACISLATYILLISRRPKFL